MKHILLPTDFSKNAWNAMFTAIKLYANFTCKFYVLNCYALEGRNIGGFKSTVRSGMVHKALKTTSQTGLKEIMQYVKENQTGPNHQFETISYSGDLVSGIKSSISKYDIETIVMGTKGATGAKSIFLGSNTVNTLKKIKNCVLIAVPKKFDFKALKSVVLPTEYTHFFPKPVLKPLLELIGTEDAEVKIFHVAQEFKMNEQQEANKAILKRRLKGYAHSFYKVTIKSTVARAIRDFSEAQNADLIVLTNYSHTFLEKITQEPVVRKMMFKSSRPIMVLPDLEG